jgi:isoleucyl-tRNA synthetase
MDLVRQVSSVALALRKVNGLRVRLPLHTLNVVTQDVRQLEPFVDLIADELNVKAVKLTELSLESTTEFGVVRRLTVNSRAVGPRLGKQVQAVIGASKAGDWSEVDGRVVCGGIELLEGEYELDLVADLGGGKDGANTDFIGILAGGGFLILDGSVSAELSREGAARDLVRAVQQARRDADFDVSDRIELQVFGNAEVASIVAEHEALIKHETLTIALTVTDEVSQVAPTIIGDDLAVAVTVKRA